jgi:outer membrane protein assembly factor BamB
MHNRYLVALTFLIAFQSSALADDWPAFRGLHGNGISQESGFPTTWGPDRNIVWKVPLAGPGNGSPIVSNGHIFLTLADDDGRRRSLYCFDRRDGRQIWVRTVPFDKSEPTHKTNPHSSSTPAADGTTVVVWHGSAGLYAYDFSGEQLWTRDLGEFRHMWGDGGSPVIFRDRVIVNCGPGQRVFVTALDLKDGHTIWEQEEPQDSQVSDARADGAFKGSWTTPVVARVGEEKQIVCTMPTRVNGYDPATGRIVWTCEGIRGPKGDLAYSSPMISQAFCVAIGGFEGPSMGIRLGEKGDLTKTSRQWRLEKSPQSIGTGILADGYVYRVNASAGPLVDCLDARTGKRVWHGPRGGVAWASMVMAGDVLYATNQEATTFVFNRDPNGYEEVAQNKLNETCNATPALSDGEIFLRTHEHLYCVGLVQSSSPSAR